MWSWRWDRRQSEEEKAKFLVFEKEGIIFRNPIIEELAKSRDTYADNLRRQPAHKWAALGQMCSYEGKERYPLEVWGEAVSFLLGCPICFDSYEQIGDSLKPFCLNVR